MSLFGEKAYIINTDNNRVVVHPILKLSENNISTKTANYAIKPTHGLINLKRKASWYFVNSHSNGCYNPSTLKTDFDELHKKVTNFINFYGKLIAIVRNAEMQEVDHKEINTELKRTIYDFNSEKMIKSDNINVTPSTQKSIMENEVAKGLSARARVAKGFMLMLIGLGLLPGMILGAWLAGDVYHQEDFNQNYYQEKPNETVVVTAQMGINLNSVRSFEIPNNEIVGEVRTWLNS